uniref:glycosyltransferase n=1 Tax=Cyanobium sp. TaxID=2164130 RepID=UPI0040481477
MRLLILSDSLAPWHSFWIRVGQYLPHLPWPAQISQDPTAIDGLGNGDRLLVYRYACGWGDLADGLRRARSRGVGILSDLDDYLWQARGWDKLRLLGLTRALRQCHRLTCSTPALLEQLQVMFPRQELVLVPNSAPQLPAAKPPTPQPPPLRIGWTGAPWTRPADLALLRPLAAWIAARPGQLQLVHVGHGEGHLSLAEALGLSPSQVEVHPLEAHQRYLQQLNFHIGLAPLATTGFNHYKSAIKVIEYSALGIPWLASDTGPYQELCSSWAWRGRLCRTAHDWIEQLQPLLGDQFRQQEGATLQRLCIQNASFGSGLERWRQILAES